MRARYTLVCLLAAFHVAAFSQSSRSAPRGDALLGPQPDVVRVLANSADILDRTIPKFAQVKDPAIQQLRDAMERERAVLGELIETLNKREAILAELTETSAK